MEELAGKALVAGSQKSTLMPIGGVLGGEGNLKKLMLILKMVDGSTSTLAPTHSGRIVSHIA